ncbi:MAG TPA: DUF1616 domain-containing protein [Ktedonobacterales bacterium]|nr:DUF1616 domain-containing protein [Ktedonobacterales bacterium]
MVRESLDLLCIMLIVAGEFILVGSGIVSGPVNIVFGVLLALVLPGYALSAAVFRMRSVRTAERAALTLGISLSVAILGGLVLDALPGGLETQTWLFLLGGVTVTASVIALWRRTRHATAMRILESRPIALTLTSAPREDAPPDEATPQPPQLKLNRETAVYFLGVIQRVLRQALRRVPYRPILISGLAFAVFLTGIVIAVNGAIAQQTSGAVTQLWMLPDSKAPTTLRIGIHTEAAQPMEYRLALSINGTSYSSWDPIFLTSTDTWQVSVTMPAPAPGDAEQIEADLYRADHPDTILRHVSVTLSGGAAPTATPTVTPSPAPTKGAQP